MVKISEIELTPVQAKKGLTFFANCVLDNKYYLGNIAVFTKLSGKGFRCVYPTKTLPNDKQIPIFYPIKKEVGEQIEKAISQKAKKLLIPENYQFAKSKGGDDNG